MTDLKVLIVEDDCDLLHGMRIRLQATGYEVVTAEDAVQAAIVARKEQPDLLILDIGLPGGNGIDLIETMRRLVPPAPAIIVTAHDPATHAGEARKAGAVEFLQKPVDHDVLLQAMKRALFTGEPPVPRDQTPW